MVNVAPEHIIEACKNSLDRLGVSYIDLYYLHRVPAGGIQALQKSLEALIVLLREGKIRYVGLSEASAKAIQFSADYLENQGFPEALAAVQSELSLLSQGPLTDGVFETCKKLGIIFVPYSPLSRGLLTDKMHRNISFDAGDFRQYLPRFQGENLESNLIIRDKLQEFAKTKGCTLTQLALAWLLAQGKEIVPIPGTRYIKNLQENLGALEITLTPQDLEKIQEIVSSLGVKGSRYPYESYEPQNIAPESAA